MHFIKPIYVIEPFEITRAIILILVTAAIGFVFGISGCLGLERPAQSLTLASRFLQAA
jgi:hypothetical protein